MKKWEVKKWAHDTEFDIWTAYIKTDSFYLIPVPGDSEQEARNRAGQIVREHNGYEAMREALQKLYLSIRINNPSDLQVSVLKQAKQILKESE